MIHYHGTPITPRLQLLRMKGRNFCVPFADDRDKQTCLQIGQSVMFDNGAFTAYRTGAKIDTAAYYRWLEPVLRHPHFAVVPDVIDGTVEDQHRMLAQWPRETLGYDCAAAVFHLHLPLTHLFALCNGFDKVCLGSSGEFWSVGSPSWCRRMDEIFNELTKRGYRTWIHGLRMLGQTDGGWPLASADSTNIAQNFKPGCAECMADSLDATQPSAQWSRRELQGVLI